MALTPSDVMAGKAVVQLGLAGETEVRAALRTLDRGGEADLISHLSEQGLLEPAGAETVRARVALYEQVWAEAIYLRYVEKHTGMSAQAAARVLAEVESSSERIGEWLVRVETIDAAQDAAFLERRRRRLSEDGARIVERYRTDDFKGVARPLIADSDLAPESFSVSRLFRTETFRDLVERARHEIAARIAPPADAAEAAPLKATAAKPPAPSLGALMDRAPGRSLPPDLVRHVFARLLRALEAIHAQQVVHLAVDPAHVFVDPGNERAVALSKPRAPRPPTAAPVEWQTLRRLAGDIDGAPAYLSPEVISHRTLDGRADIYSLGVLVFEALTGKLPLPAETRQGFLGQHLINPPYTLAEAAPERSWPPELEDLLTRMLAKDPEGRPARCSDILTELDTGLNESFARIA